MTDQISSTPAPAQEVLSDNAATAPRDLPHQAPPKTPEELAAEAKPEPKPEKTETARDSIKKAMDKVLKDEPVKPEPKEKPEAKAEKPAPAEAKPDAEAPPAPKQEAGQDDGGDAPSEGEKAVKYPARLLPKAREVWANTPRVVQAEFERMEVEHAAEIESHREAKAFADEVQEYREMAKQAGTTVKSALDRYVAFDRQISQDFGKGIAAIAKDQGRQPQEVITGILRAYGVTPQQFAQAVMKNPQAFAAAPQQPQAQPAQTRPDPTAQAAMREVQTLKQQLQVQQLEASVVAPFAANHPRFAELEQDIAFFLQSGKVPTSLSLQERLEVAYDMAERINPSPVTTPAAPASPDREAPARPAANKSISGAPGNGPQVKGKPKVMSIKEAIAAASRGV